MKKIMNGKLYDTKTAERIGYYTNGSDCRNFRWYEEELYRKKTGEFFLYGAGGPLSPYARCTSPDGRSFGDGDALIPQTIDEAKAWAERHMDADDYIEVFGEVEE